VNVPADFGSLGAEGGDNVRFSHAPKIGVANSKFLSRLRHNTAIAARARMLGLLYCSAAWCRALPVLVHGREKVQIGHFGFWSMMLFLGVPTIDFIYEWKKGALEWD
jgi:hypothetical protein